MLGVILSAIVYIAANEKVEGTHFIYLMLLIEILIMLIVLIIIRTNVSKETAETVLHSKETEINIIQMETGEYYIDTGDSYVFLVKNENGDIEKFELHKMEVEFKESRDIKLVRHNWTVKEIKKSKISGSPSTQIVNKVNYILYCDTKALEKK